MYAEINPDSLKKSLESVANLVDEAKIHVSENGFNIKAVDPANVAMVDKTIEETEFDVLNTGEGVLGVNLNQLLSQVEAIKNEIVLEEDIEKTVHLEVDETTKTLSLWGSPGSMSFDMSLLDPESIRDEPDIPDIDLPGLVEIDSQYFDHAIRVASDQSDHLHMETLPDENMFYMAAEGDTSSWDTKLDEDDIAIDSLIAADAKGLYSVDYFDDIRKGIPSGTVVTIEMGNELPVRLMFEFPDSDISVTYMIAPRIKDEG